MAFAPDSLAVAALRRLHPECAHDIALGALSHGLGRGFYQRVADAPELGVDAFGLHFANPIGLAAGFDKDAVAAGPLLRMGFGFVEVGSITPRPQRGNTKPRLFRLTQDRAIINRMGMNGAGVGEVQHRLARIAAAAPKRGVLGASIAINKQGANPQRDYPALVVRLAPFVDYLVLNVSSPNTPGLRDLQEATRLAKILRRSIAVAPKRMPLLVKIAPDLDEGELAAIVATAAEAGVAGLIVGNTTIERPASLKSVSARETGGLSGAPLLAKSTYVLARAYRLSGERMPLIGCGGVASGRDALQKIKAGATLVELLTAFAYEGPRLIPRIKAELLTALKDEGFASLARARGVDAERLTARGLAAVV